MKQKESETHPSELSISDYTYELPDDRIAKYPLSQRDQSKLLVYQDGAISERLFKNLPDLLQPNDMLVFNDTRVIHARLHFKKPTGAHVEVLCLEPLEPAEVTEAFAQKKSSVWRAMVRNAKRLKEGVSISRHITTDAGSYELKAELRTKEADTSVIEFSWEADLTFAEVLDNVGTLPLPPYLNRETEAEDEERYQTLYAKADGSVAAPTAGLHFTQNVFDDLKQRQVESLFVTLHVGAGTFKPVKSDTMQDHEMHRERIVISRNAIQKMCDAVKQHRLIAVGTTSLRTVESIYWFGVKLLSGHEMEELSVSQWEPYELSKRAVNAPESLNAVLDWMHEHNHGYLSGQTQLLIAPGYQIRMADALITNFHQPQSTLLLLVAAFIGEDWRRVYDYALANDFRFLSFGDGSVLFREPLE